MSCKDYIQSLLNRWTLDPIHPNQAPLHLAQKYDPGKVRYQNLYLKLISFDRSSLRSDALFYKIQHQVCEIFPRPCQTWVLKLEEKKTSENNRYRWLNKKNCTDCDGKKASLSKIDHRSSLSLTNLPSVPALDADQLLHSNVHLFFNRQS